MANIPLKSIKFPDLDDTYTVPSNAGELPYNKSATYPADTVGKALQNIGDSSAPAIIETAQGSIASFDDGADNVPVKDLIAEIVPLQSGSGDPSPDNVRAISGWTEANISVSGVNVWDEEWEVLNPSSLNNAITSKNFCPCVPGATYYFSMPNHTGSIYYGALYFYDKDKTQITYTYCANATVIAPSNAYYFKLITNSSGYVYGNTYNNDISINYPSTDHDYHAFSGEVHTISFASAGTVYGGRLDVKSGVLVVDKERVDMGSLGWDYYNGVFYAGLSMKVGTFGEMSDIDCEAYKPIASGYTSQMANETIMQSYEIARVYVKDDAYTTAASFKSAVSGKHFTYPLATPQTYQLTPTEVKSLLKNNNIWADTGNVTVEYVADTKTFIENLVNA